MVTSVLRVGVLQAEKSGPPLVTARRDAGASLDSRYARAGPAEQPFPAGVPLVGILRSDELASPDQIRVTASSRRDNTFLLAVERRRYTGSLAANVVTVAFVEMEMGDLEPNDYEFAAEVTSLEFDRFEHPESAGNPSLMRHRVDFQVR